MLNTLETVNLAGWGVVNSMYKVIPSGSFVVEYVGELIPKEEAAKREAYYSNAKFGSYMFYFKNEGKELW